MCSLLLYYNFELDIIKNFFLILGQVAGVTKFFSKLIICLYCRKYSSWFEPNEMLNLSTESNCDTIFDNIREKTWHKTIVSNNPLPTTSSIILHCQRISAVLALNSSATFLDLNIPEYLKLGWKLIDINGALLLSPLWDFDESRNKLGFLRKIFLQKCGCAKSSCRTKRCRCKSSGSFCSNICSCNDCENRQVGDGDGKEEEEDDQIQSASKEEDDDGEIDYQEENDPFTNELLGLFSDEDDDSDYDGKEENMVDFLLA